MPNPWVNADARGKRRTAAAKSISNGPKEIEMEERKLKMIVCEMMGERIKNGLKRSPILKRKKNVIN